MTVGRAFASSSVSLTGGAVVALAVSAMLDGLSSAFDVVLAGLGITVGLALLLAGGLLYAVRDELTTAHVRRVAAWNALGVVVLGLILTLVVASPSVSLPAYVVANVLGVSAVAHVLIGVNDVRRIRVRELASERKKLAVLNRITRHNLRNDTQVMIGYAEALAGRAEDEESRQIARRLSEQASDLATMNEKLGRFQAAVEDDRTGEGSVALGPLVESIRADLKSNHPEASITVEVPDLSVDAGENLRMAILEAADNGLRYGDAVAITAARVDGAVRIRVSDEGPGIPDHELAPLADDREITQLEHGTGLGLRIIKTVVDSYDGHLSFDTDESGTTVWMDLPAT